MAKYPQTSSNYVGDLGVDGATFSGKRIQPFALTNYDSVVIEGVVLPIMKGSLRGGVTLAVEGRKSAGTDFKRYVSQGLDTTPVGFTLNLFIDYSQDPPRDYRAEYEKVEPRLVPKGLDARNAVKVYNPSLAGRGVTQMIPTRQGLLQPVDVDRWTVDVEGMDVRFVNSGPRGATKKVEQDQLRTTGVVPGAIVGPDQAVRARVGKKNTWRDGP